MTTSTQFEPSTSLPGTQFLSRYAKLKVNRIPALAEIMGSEAYPESPTESTYTPLTTLLVTQNPDGTYSVLNDLGLISPEAKRTKADHVRAIIAQFDESTAHVEDLLRRHLAYVEPSRCTRSHSEFVAATQRGAIDGIPELYVGKGVNPRGYVAISAVLPTGQLAKSTFQRIRKSFLALTKKIRKQIQTETRRKNPDAKPTPNISASKDSTCASMNKEKVNQKKSKMKNNKGSSGQGELF